MAADATPLTPGRVKALTLYPEHAELFRLALRWIETRSYAVSYRGPIVLHAGKRDPDSAAARRDPLNHVAMGAIPHGNPLTLGAIVASARLVDCVPISDGPPRPMGPRIYDIGGTLTLRRTAGEVWPTDIQDQRKYGIFTPGRYGWLLEDLAPSTDRCPACWATGTRDLTGEACDDLDCPCDLCPVCEGRQSCDPIPTRGRLGLWDWVWGTERAA